MNYQGFLFCLQNWKLITHLLLHTRRFGVNNQWRTSFDSLFSSQNRGIWHIVGNYKAAKFRAVACGFLTRQECRNLGWRSEI